MFKDPLTAKRVHLIVTLVTEGLWDVADVINLQGIHGNFFGAIVDEVEFSAFVQGTSKLSFPLGRIRIIHSFLELPRLHSPGLDHVHNQHRHRL